MTSCLLLLGIGSIFGMNTVQTKCLYQNNDLRVDKTSTHIKVYNTKEHNNICLCTYKHEQADMACVSRDNVWVASSSFADGTVHIVNIQNGTSNIYSHDTGVTCISFKKNSPCLFASGSKDGEIKVCNLDQSSFNVVSYRHTVDTPLNEKTVSISRICFSEKMYSYVIASVSANGQIKVYDLVNSVHVPLFETRLKPDVAHIRQKQLEKELFSCSAQNIYEKKQNISISLLSSGWKEYLSIVHETIGKGSFNFEVYEIDTVKKAKENVHCSFQAKPLRTIVKGNHLLVQLYDESVYIFDLDKRQECIFKKNCPSVVTDFIINEKKENIVLECQNEQIGIVGYHKGKRVIAFKSPIPIQKKGFIQNRYFFASSLKDQTKAGVAIYDMHNGKLLFSFTLPFSCFDIDHFFVTSDQKYFLITLDNGIIQGFDSNGKEILRKKMRDLGMTVGGKIVNGFISDRYVALVGSDEVVTVFDRQKKKKVFQWCMQSEGSICSCNVTDFKKNLSIVILIKFVLSNGTTKIFYVAPRAVTSSCYIAPPVQKRYEMHYFANNTVKVFDVQLKREVISISSKEAAKSLFIDEKHRFAMFNFDTGIMIYDINSKKCKLSRASDIPAESFYTNKKRITIVLANKKFLSFKTQTGPWVQVSNESFEYEYRDESSSESSDDEDQDESSSEDDFDGKNESSAASMKEDDREDSLGYSLDQSLGFSLQSDSMREDFSPAKRLDDGKRDDFSTVHKVSNNMTRTKEVSVFDGGFSVENKLPNNMTRAKVLSIFDGSSAEERKFKINIGLQQETTCGSNLLEHEEINIKINDHVIYDFERRRIVRHEKDAKRTGKKRNRDKDNAGKKKKKRKLTI